MSLFLVRLSVEKGILSVFFLFSVCLFYCFAIVPLPLSVCTSTYMNTHTHTHTHTTTQHTHTHTPPHSPYLTLSLLHFDHRIFCGGRGGEHSLSYNNSFHSIRQVNESRWKARKSLLRQLLQLERLQKAFTDSAHCSQGDCSNTGHLAPSCRLCLFFWWDPQPGAVDQRLSKHSTAWCVGARMYPFSSRVHGGDRPMFFSSLSSPGCCDLLRRIVPFLSAHDVYIPNPSPPPPLAPSYLHTSTWWFEELWHSYWTCW